MNQTFEALGILPVYLDALQKRGIMKPTPIQSQAIPPLLAKRDVIAKSQTGTGKTLAYLLPIMQNIDPSLKELQAVVLAPTRELAMQIWREMELLAAAAGMRAQSLIGGVPMARQVDKLRQHLHIIAGTPGRVLELIKLKKLKMHKVRSIVADEADQLLEQGAMSEVEAIFASALRDRQIVFLSATMPAEISRLAERWMREPHKIAIEGKGQTSEHIQHLSFTCEERDKIDTLRRLARLLEPKPALVFVNETDDIGRVAAKMKFHGLSLEALYGESDKVERATVLQGFRDGKFQLLLATDVAARGLDIPHLDYVINFDLPVDADHYVHRVGRTGRMERKGTAISLAAPKEHFILDKFQKALEIAIEPKSMHEGKIVDARPERKAVLRESGKPESDKAGGKDEAAAAPAQRAAKPRQSGNAPGAQRSEAVSRQKLEERKKARDRDQKNKGAPRWLKEKREQKDGLEQKE